MHGYSEKVRAILKKLGIDKPPVRVEDAAKLFSVKVVPYGKFPDKLSGFITDKGGFLVIGVNSNHASVRQRFTIAHELGHFLLGHEIDNHDLSDADNRPVDQEKEANGFAAELLMPRDFLKTDIQANNKQSIPDLARRYEVSEQAMSIHLLHTGLINHLEPPKA